MHFDHVEHPECHEQMQIADKETGTEVAEKYPCMQNDEHQTIGRPVRRWVERYGRSVRKRNNESYSSGPIPTTTQLATTTLARSYLCLTSQRPPIRVPNLTDFCFPWCSCQAGGEACEEVAFPWPRWSSKAQRACCVVPEWSSSILPIGQAECMRAERVAVLSPRRIRPRRSFLDTPTQMPTTLQFRPHVPLSQLLPMVKK